MLVTMKKIGTFGSYYYAFSYFFDKGFVSHN